MEKLKGKSTESCPRCKDLKDWGRNQIFHHCVKGIAPYPRILCSVCPPTVPIDGSTDFNAYEKLKRLTRKKTSLELVVSLAEIVKQQGGNVYFNCEEPTLEERKILEKFNQPNIFKRIWKRFNFNGPNKIKS